MGSLGPSHDIAIVGAGPVGLTLALLLHAYGHTPVVLERYANQYPQPRAVGIFHQAIQVYDALGLHEDLFGSVVRDIRNQMSDISHFIGTEGTPVLSVPLNGELKTGASRAFALHQPTLEKVLEATCERRNIPVIRSTQVLDVKDRGSNVVLHVAGPDGEREISAQFVVGCDGAKSIVRQAAGIPFIDSGGIRSRWLVIDVVPQSVQDAHQWKDAKVGKQYLDWRRPHTAVPSPHDRRRWEFLLLPHETTEEAKYHDFAWPLLAKFGCTVENATIEREAVYTLEGRWAEKFYKGRILLAGDAAHTTPPFLGQGLNSGLRDAANLAWRLVLALQNPEKDHQRIFQHYSDEQLGTTKKMVIAAIGLERLICVTDKQQALERDAMLLEAPPPPPPNLEMLDEPGTFIPAPEGQFGPFEGPGHHFIDDVVELGQERGRLFRLVKFGFLIIQAQRREEGENTALAAAIQQLDKTIPATLLTIGEAGFKDVNGTITRFLLDHKIAGVILRPDHYVYATVKNAKELEGLIQGLLKYPA